MGLKFYYRNENGNLMFIILVAVVLFAALTYALTQNARFGGGIGEDSSTIASSTLLQYTARVRSKIASMQFGGISTSELEFNRPEDLDSCTMEQVCVFHPKGGGLPYVPVDMDAMEPGMLNNNWGFSGLFEIKGVGTDTAHGYDGNDPVMLVYGMSKSVCSKIHEKLGISSVQQSRQEDEIFTSILDYSDYHMNSGWFEPNEERVLGSGVTSGLEGKPEGCFITTGGHYVFYSVLSER